MQRVDDGQSQTGGRTDQKTERWIVRQSDRPGGVVGAAGDDEGIPANHPEVDRLRFVLFFRPFFLLLLLLFLFFTVTAGSGSNGLKIEG